MIKKLTRNLLSTILTVLLAVGVFGIAAPKEVHAAGGGIKVTATYAGQTYTIVSDASINDTITLATIKSKINLGTVRNQKSIMDVSGSGLTKSNDTTLKITSTGNTIWVYFSEDNPPKKCSISMYFDVKQTHTHSWTTASYSANGNVITATCQGSGTCSLTKPTLTLNATGKTYDGSAVTATLTKSDTWKSENLPTPTITYNPANSKNVGTYTASAKVGNATATQSFTISPKQLTLTGVTANNKTYDGTDVADLNTDSASLSGKIGSDDVQIDKVTGVYTAGKAAGNGKAISATATLKGTDAGNYEISPISLTANIDKKGIKLIKVYINDKPYDGNSNATRSTSKLPDFDGLIEGDVVDYKAECTFENRHVGNDKIVNVKSGSIIGRDKDNYYLIESVATTSTASITPVDLYIRGITVSNKVYDRNTNATADTSNVSYDSILFPLDEVSIDPESVKASFNDKNVGNDKPVTVTLNLQGEQKNNYNPVITDVKGNITPKTITVSGITVNTRQYDKTTNAPLNTNAATFDGIVTGDELTVSGTGTYTDGSDVGEDKPVSITDLTLGGTDARNYTLSSDSQDSTTGEVTAKEVTVSGITASDKKYDGNTDATLVFTGAEFAGMIEGDSLSVEGKDTQKGTFDNKNVGTGKTVTLPELKLTGDDAKNYTIKIDSQTTTTAAITAEKVTVSDITATGKVYDGNTDADLVFTGAKFAGIIEGDSLSVEGKDTQKGTFDNKNVGTGKTVTLPELKLTGDDAGNYELADSGQQTQAEANITQREITVSGIKSEGKEYDGNNVATGSLYYEDAILAGKVDGDGEFCDDKLAVTATGTFDSKDYGVDKTITFTSLVLTGSEVNNYKLAETGQQDSCLGDIDKYKVIVTADNKTKKFGDNDPELTFTSDPEKLIGDDKLVGNLSRHEGEEAGKDYMITVGDLHDKNHNYAITYEHAFLTITQATENNVTASITGWTYGDTPESPRATATFGADDKNPATFTYSDSAEGTYTDTVPTDAGTYYVKATVKETTNYVGAVSDPVEFTIAPRPVKVSGIEAEDKTYDGKTDAALKYEKVAFDDKVGDDDLSVTATGAFVDAAAGEDKTVNISRLELTGTAKDNYVLAEEGQQDTATATIAPRPVKVSGIEAEDKTYDGKTDAALKYEKVAFDDKVGDDDLSVTATGAFVDAAAGEDKTVNISRLELTGTAKNNYVLASEGQQKTTTATIEPKEVKLQWSDTELTYNGKAQKPKATVTNLVEGDECEVTVEGAQTNSNIKSETDSYTAEATELSNPNYKLPEEDEKKTTEFTIAPKELTSDMLSVDPESIKNDGTKKGPKITLKDEEVGVDLTDKDYELSDETESDKSGTHFFEVKGKGNYTGTLSSSWVMYENRQNHDKQKGTDGKGDIEIYVDVIGNTENITVDNFTIDFAKKLLSEEDLERYNNGENVLIYVELEEESKDDVAANYKELILSEFNKVAAKDIRWFDITVWKRIGNDKATQIHDTVDNLEMTISVPDEYKNAPADNTRTFYLARSHDGEADILTKTNEKKVGLSSNKFSIYALAYKDTYHGSKYIVPKTGD